MTRKNRNARKRDKFLPAEELIAPTPEQMAHGGYVARFVLHSETGLKALAHVNEGGEENGRAFKQSHFDRLNKAGCFTEDQFLAGKWYRDMHERGCYDKPQTSNLFRVSGSVGSAEGARDMAQYARDSWRAARMAWPSDMVGFMDGLLIRNRWPKMHHRERARTLKQICDSLDDLAYFLKRKHY